jgi:BirA family biotin operon repressor/biotin-[acetyl-CoA-carboxylase] ligase
VTSPGRTLPSWRLEIHEALPSTAALCRARAAAGEPDGLAIMARAQTAGIGTRGRTWLGGAGNFFLSVLLRPGGAARDAGQWSLLAGVALAEALAHVLPGDVVLRLKWPNDVLVEGAKVAGILAESAAGPAGELAWLAVGFGVNLATAPDVPDRAVTCVARHTPPPAPEAFAATLLAAIGRWREVAARDGFAPVRAAFLERAWTRGTPLVLHTGVRTVTGAFAGLADDGALLLEADGRLRAFAAGEVTIGAATERGDPCCW